MYFLLTVKFINLFLYYCYIYVCKHIHTYKYKYLSPFSVALTYVYLGMITWNKQIIRDLSLQSADFTSLSSC